MTLKCVLSNLSKTKPLCEIAVPNMELVTRSGFSFVTSINTNSSSDALTDPGIGIRGDWL